MKSLMQMWCIVRWCTVMLLVCIETASVSAKDGKLPLETAVKVVAMPAPAAPDMQMRVSRRPVPTPTTPNAKFPQYQLGHRHTERRKVDAATSPQLRFFLNLPNETLLVHATITIDGLPFHLLRQQRVARILKEVNVGADAPSEVATVSVQNQPLPSSPAAQALPGLNIPDRLKHTMKVTGAPPTAEEVDWIISNWVDGPTIMQLNDNFQRFRANQRPEFVILDRNRDGTISAEEMQFAEKSFWECDLNQDGIIQFIEIGVAATDHRVTAPEMESGELITFLPDEASATDAYQRLFAAKRAGKAADQVTVLRFDANANGQFDAEELDALRKMEPDLSLMIAFNSASPEKSRIALTAVATELNESTEHVTVDPTGITLRVRGIPVILAAVQAQPSDQISIGAVNDGYPMLPSLDPNDDGRLTIRELRGLLETLKTFDRNHDGSLTLDEVRSPIRLCFGLGASVHRELVGIRSIHRKDVVPTIAGPEWFVRMDRNKDNDLTRGEFPGTDEQFKFLDADADELVSAEEALEFDKKTEEIDKKGANPPVENQRTATSIDSTSKKRRDADEPN